MTTTLENTPATEETEDASKKKATHRFFYIPYAHIHQAETVLIDHGVQIVGITPDVQLWLGGKYVCVVAPRELSLRGMRKLICDELVDYLATRDVTKLKVAVPVLQALINKAIRAI